MVAAIGMFSFTFRDSFVAVLTSFRERTGPRFGTNKTSSYVSPSHIFFSMSIFFKEKISGFVKKKLAPII